MPLFKSLQKYQQTSEIGERFTPNPKVAARSDSNAVTLVADIQNFLGAGKKKRPYLVNYFFMMFGSSFFCMQQKLKMLLAPCSCVQHKYSW